MGSGREQHVRDPIELDLDCGLLIFEDGEWRLRKPSSVAVCSDCNDRALTLDHLRADGGDVGAEGGEANIKDVQELKRQVQTVEDENRMLKYKMEVLIGAAHSFSVHAHRPCLTVALVAPRQICWRWRS